MFRVDADGVGQRITSAPLALGQAYRLLLPPNVGDDLGTELDSGWRIWSLDLAAQLSPTTRQMLTALGLEVGEAWPRLEWALAPASAWRTNARGESYPTFEAGTELLVNVGGVSVEEGDEAVLFLHGPFGTECLPLSTNGLVSLGTALAGRWACALMHSRTCVQPATLVFEVAESATPHITATWSATAPSGVASLEATAPPGWPVALHWRVLHEEPLTTVYAEADGSVPREDVVALLEARARARVADLVVDLGELGHRSIPHDGRASLLQVREQLTALWQERAGLVRSNPGAWLKLEKLWFEPVTTLLGYGLDARALPADADAPHDLAAWLLTIDERSRKRGITRSPSRVLVLTTDLDAAMRDCREWIDDACSAARIRAAILTDGARWTTHRKGDLQLRRREWNLDHAIGLGSLDEMLNDLAEGL